MAGGSIFDIIKMIQKGINFGSSAEKVLTGEVGKQEDFTVLNKGVNDTPLCLIEDKNIYKKYVNSIFNYDDSRKYKPLSYRYRYYRENSRELYEHRKAFNEYHLRIGDSCFVIPPEYISVSEVSGTVRVPGIRTLSTVKKKYGYSTTDISIDMYFNGYEQINGFKIESPFDETPYYIDGLRPLLAQCKISPIMPIENEMLNKECGIYCIAVQAITVSTVPGFPKVLKVNIQAVECNQSIYTDVPNFMFSDIIEWDLYRFNYQRLLTSVKSKNIHDTVKLKSVENLTSDYDFKISIFSDSTINDYKEDEKEFMNLAKAEYTTYIDNKTCDFTVQNIQFGLNNLIVSPQLSNHEKPAVQYLGGGDTGIVIQLTTSSNDTVVLFKNLIRQTNHIVKKLKQISGVGFIKIDNDLLNMMGTQFMLIDSVKVDTVPNFPNLKSITIECVSYDVLNVMQEELEGFRPFEDNRKGTKEDCITQDVSGVYNKIKQDVYAEYKMCENSNLYPDLFLPTYTELDEAIGKINTYRSKNNVDKLPFDKFAYNIHQEFLYGSPYVSTTVVDPDFYFAYGYNDIENDDFDVDDLAIIPEPTAAVVEKKYTSIVDVINNIINPGDGDSGDNGSTAPKEFSGTTEEAIKNSKNIQEAYVNVLLSQKGQAYVWGATGQVVNEANIAALRRIHGSSVKVNDDAWGKRAWDCSGFCGWGIKELGWGINRQTTSTFIPSGVCKSISKSELQPGDLVISSGHVACYIGDNKTIEAKGWKYGVCGGEVTSKYTKFGRIQWTQDVIDNYNKKKTSLSGYTNSYTDSSSNSITNTTGNYTDSYTGNSSTTTSSYQDTYNKTKSTTTTKTTTVDYSDYTLDGNVVGSSNKVQTTSSQSTIPIGKWGDYHDKHDDIIQSKCKEYNLSPNWMKALIRQECDMNEKVGPNKYNAVGLMQITKDPCSELKMEYNIEKLRTPEYNLTVGFTYMNWMRDKFGWTDYNDLISAHNCGPYGWKSKWKPNDRYLTVYEMKTHKEKVNKYYNELLSKGGQAGEYKNGVPGSDPSTPTTPTDPSTTPPSDGGTGTKSTIDVEKKHGGKTIKYHGVLGIPYTDYSPINDLKINGHLYYNERPEPKKDDPIEDDPITQDPTNPQPTPDPGDFNITQKFISRNYTPRSEKPKYIVIHDTQNPGASAMGHYNYFNDNEKGVSADFGVDSKDVIQYVNSDINYSRQCGDGGGRYGITNANSLGIEMCLERDSSYSSGTWSKTVKLTRYLMQKYNVPIERVVRHYDASRKTCPKSMMANNWSKWNQFISEVKGSNSNGNQMPFTLSRSIFQSSPVMSVIANYPTISNSILTDSYKKVLKNINESHSLEFDKSMEDCIGGRDYSKIVDSFADPNNSEYLSTSFVNDINYNKRGSMLRAYPTFMVMINDDNEAWFDGKKLWSNYYPYKSVINLNCFHEREQPVGTLKMSITNMSGNLTRLPSNSVYKSIGDDDDYSGVNKFLYKNFGFILGSPKVTDTMIESRNIINKEIKLQPGARLHVRAGYGSNPFSLNTIFNGTIAEMTTGEVIEVVAQSDGAELVNNIVSMGKEDETNSTTNLSKEASNMISSLLIDRSSFFKNLVSGGKWGEASKYNIEHFGTPIGHYSGMNREREYDLCKNIYIGRFNKALYCAQSRWNVFDSETDIEMFINNKTPWDVMSTVTNTLPEFVCQPVYHQFDSRIFFGLPTWLYKYRYDINESGAVLEQAKTFQQMHLVNSSDILDNRVKCTNKFSCTNVVAMYTVAGDMKSTPTLFSDKTIDWSKQKTKVIDTIVQQDYLLWEPIWEVLGLERARENAIAIGISNLLHSWGTQYFDDLIFLGKPGIKPIDQLYIDDEYADMYGICTARSVTHTIGPDTGFITTVSPHMESICSLQDSGSTNVYRSKMALLNTISMLANAKNNTIKDLDLFTSMVYDIQKKVDNTGSPEYMYDALKGMKTQVIDDAKKLENLNSLIGDVKKSINVSNAVINVFETIERQIFYRTMSIPVKAIIGFGLRDIIDYFKYDNCIIARPLFHKGYPFISGAKGQTTLIEGLSNNPYFIDEEGAIPQPGDSEESPTNDGVTQPDTDVFKDTVFMGDSLTVALSTYGFVSSDKVVGKVGLNVSGALGYVNQVAAKKPKSVFVMYGVNDLGNYSDAGDFADKYIELITSLKSSCQGAKINVISILPISNSASSRDSNLSNEKIRAFNSMLSRSCTLNGTRYIDLTSLVGQSDLEQDGIHLKKSFYNGYLTALKKYI